MIATITMNPCIDKTIRISKFNYGGLNLVSQKREDISGKGINVSIVLENLGETSIALGLIYDKDKEYMLTELAKLSLNFHGIEVHGKLRENIKLLDEETRITTEFNQLGEMVSSDKIDAFMDLLDEHLSEISLIIVDGSVPKGVDKNFYFRIIQKAKDLGIKTLLDADGDLFKEGIKAIPTIIKPNLYELKLAYSLKDDSVESIVEVCHQIIREGVEIVCVSMSERGALIVSEKEAFICKPSNIEVISTQGAGDSMVAGISIAYLNNMSLENMLKFGVAAAQGSLIREGTLLCLREDFEKFYSILNVETINITKNIQK